MDFFSSLLVHRECKRGLHPQFRPGQQDTDTVASKVDHGQVRRTVHVEVPHRNAKGPLFRPIIKGGIPEGPIPIPHHNREVITLVVCHGHIQAMIPIKIPWKDIDWTTFSAEGIGLIKAPIPMP
jgi:hypothetical protein